MTEKELEFSLAARLRAGELATVQVARSTSQATTLQDLCGQFPYDVFEDDSRWNNESKAMPEIIGGMTPDIVLRSAGSRQNRIYIEVKESAPLNYGIHDSQVVRYFLHLLASSETRPNGKDDIGRAILLAAPPAWFATKRIGEAWTYFIGRYTDLARAFNVTLGEVHLT